ncbi:hypothetical protein FHV99_004628 [Ochrobactrum sp. P20RRXII]|nr:hypothetical protein [Ochrobactrum sp. P20RRXII]NIH77376.1 hypothetical protein [Ochrobactrum sp. P20RRXII]
MTKVFPSIMILMSIGAAAAYLYDGDWRRTTYWIAASILTATVTF